MDVPGYALITGAASGMGRETAKKFAQDGAAGVALLDLNSQALDAVQKEVEPLSTIKGFKVVSHVLDVSDETAVDRVVDEVHKAFGRIDYVVNGQCLGQQSVPGQHRANPPLFRSFSNPLTLEQLLASHSNTKAEALSLIRKTTEECLVSISTARSLSYEPQLESC